MNYGAGFVLGLLFGVTAWSAPPGDASANDAAIVARARETVNGMLGRLPNYTCEETLERSERPATRRKFKLIDRTRMEVAFVNGKELYAPVGSAGFKETNPGALLHGPGAVGTGDFGEQLWFNYQAGMPLAVAGRERWKDQEAWKLIATVPFELSHYVVITPPASSIAAYAVTAWHDAATFELLRFELVATRFRSKLPLRRVLKATEYATVEIEGRPMRLPALTELTMTALNGFEDRTVTTFSNCREYHAESKLTFDDPGNAPSAAPPPPQEIALPSGVEVRAELDAPVDLRQAAQGDAVTLTVTRDALKGAQRVLPAGARVRGRLGRITCQDLPVAYCFARLDLESYTDGAHSGPFRAALILPDLERQLTAGTHAAALSHSVQVPGWVATAHPDEAILYSAVITRLPRGYRLIWRTL